MSPTPIGLCLGLQGLLFISMAFAQNIHTPVGSFEKREVLPAKAAGEPVSAATMQSIYEQVSTPFKYGIVMKGDQGAAVDSPSIFRHGDKWFMVYIQFTGERGYETFLAQSEDLLHWNKRGPLLSFSPSGWDAVQAAGGIALQDTQWGGSYGLEEFDGKYWMSYIGGAEEGYETDPLAIGMAWTPHPEKAQPWNRLPENPVLSTAQPDLRPFERQTLYRSTVIHDKKSSLGYPFVMFYNGKIRNGYEKIGMAVSRDKKVWHRYGAEPIISNGDEQSGGISGDPQVIQIGDVWVLFYFGAFWRPGAFDTFACSYDLVHWTQWTGPDLISSSEPWDQTFAHKPWLIHWKGVTYHFYCAVGDQGRCIAVATSQDLKK